MKRLALAVSLALVVVAGCDDDGDTGGKTDAGDAGGDTKPSDASGVMCTGTFAAFSRSQLGASTSASGACRGATDLEQICVADFSKMATGCGSTCLMISPGNQDMALMCVEQCLQSSKAVTTGCTNCYRDLYRCASTMCTSECADPTTPACRTCQTNKGCLGAFFTCSGLPSSGTPPDASTDTRVDATGDGRVDAVMDAGTDMRDATIETGGDAGDARVDGGADAGADAVDAADAADATAG